MKVTLTKNDKSITVEGEREEVRQSLKEHGTEFFGADPTTKKIGSFREFYDAHKGKPLTATLLAAAYLTQPGVDGGRIDFTREDLARIASTVGVKVTAVRVVGARARGWFESTSRARYRLTKLGQAVIVALPDGGRIKPKKLKAPKLLAGDRTASEVANEVLVKGPATLEAIAAALKDAGHGSPEKAAWGVVMRSAERLADGRYIKKGSKQDGEEQKA